MIMIMIMIMIRKVIMIMVMIMMMITKDPQSPNVRSRKRTSFFLAPLHVHTCAPDRHLVRLSSTLSWQIRFCVSSTRGHPAQPVSVPSPREIVVQALCEVTWLRGSFVFSLSQNVYVCMSFLSYQVSGHTALHCIVYSAYCIALCWCQLMYQVQLQQWYFCGVVLRPHNLYTGYLVSLYGHTRVK